MIAAPAATVFELIADPAQQPRWDGNDNLGEAASGQRVRAIGQTFVMTLTSGSIRENHVVEFDEGRLIAWRPSEPGAQPPGHLWRWELTPIDEVTTRVVHTYDWTHLDDPKRLERARATTVGQAAGLARPTRPSGRERLRSSAVALWLRSMRRRPGAALGVFLIVTVASAASVAGPALVRAAEQSGLRSTLAAAPAGAYDIEIDGPTDNNSLGAVVDGASAAAARANQRLFQPACRAAAFAIRPRWRDEPEEDLHGVRGQHGRGCLSHRPRIGCVPDASGRRARQCPPRRSRRTRASPSWDGAATSRCPAATATGSSHRGSRAWARDPVLTTEATLEEIDPAPMVMARLHLRVAALTLDRLGTQPRPCGRSPPPRCGNRWSRRRPARCRIWRALSRPTARSRSWSGCSPSSRSCCCAGTPSC